MNEELERNSEHLLKHRMLLAMVMGKKQEMSGEEVGFAEYKDWGIADVTPCTVDHLKSERNGLNSCVWREGCLVCSLNLI
jgi:hypothetical protein